MSKKLKIILFIVLFSGAVIGIAFGSKYLSRIPANAPGTVGNTAGNLNNMGYFCEDDEYVYFANAYDGYSIYRMTKDEQDFKKLGSAQVQYLNTGGKYLYYYQVNADASLGYGHLLRVNGLYRMDKKGHKALCLSKNTVQAVNLVDDYVLFQMMIKGETDLHLFRIKTDKTDEKDLADYLVNPACALNGSIYYNGTQKDHYLYSMNPNGSSTLILEKNLWNPYMTGNYVYYMDMEHDYRLCRYDLTADTETVLTDERVDTFNVCDGYIYYQTNSQSSPALMRMLTDGTNPEIVAEGVYRNINITSQNVYFQDFGSDTPVYHTPTYGPVNVTGFDAALNAALANAKKK